MFHVVKDDVPRRGMKQQRLPLSSHRRVNRNDHDFRQMTCAHRHCYCLSCLQRSMAEFVRHSAVPVCHPTLCDHLLSRHDVAVIPLERRLSDQLFKLVRGEQRPQCSHCHFYVDVQHDDDFHQHVDSCDSLIPCEVCQLPYPFLQLETHVQHCQHDPTSEQEKLTMFLLPRTKYPFTRDQIRFYIEQEHKTCHDQLDPLTLVNKLAEFGNTDRALRRHVSVHSCSSRIDLSL